MTSSQITSPPRVLVVEDDEKLAALLCRALRDDGLAAEPAFDGLILCVGWRPNRSRACCST